jgi:hypothetical protein
VIAALQFFVRIGGKGTTVMSGVHYMAFDLSGDISMHGVWDEQRHKLFRQERNSSI